VSDFEKAFLGFDREFFDTDIRGSAIFDRSALSAQGKRSSTVCIRYTELLSSFLGAAAYFLPTIFAEALPVFRQMKVIKLAQ
jgi:hypothetical protein